MNIPSEASRVLKENTQFCFDDKFDVTTDDSSWFRENLGVRDPSSSFIAYYKNVAFPPIGNGAELLTLEAILESAKEDLETLPQGIGSRFLRLTSFEGESAYYFDVESDKVYDTPQGKELDMINSNLPALANSFFSFLKSYYSKI